MTEETKEQKELFKLIAQDSRYNKDNIMTPRRLDFETREAMVLRTKLVNTAIKAHLKGTYIKANPIKVKQKTRLSGQPVKK